MENSQHWEMSHAQDRVGRVRSGWLWGASFGSEHPLTIGVEHMIRVGAQKDLTHGEKSVISSLSSILTPMFLCS